MKENLAVCYVADFNYLNKHFNTIYEELKNNGKYDGPILIITSLFSPTFLVKNIRKNSNVIVLRYKRIKFSNFAKNNYLNLNTKGQPNRFKNKSFQWHKIHLFDTKIKRWDYIFYMDINMHIHFDINKVLNFKPSNQLFARADGYPDYDKKLSSQFDNNHALYDQLKMKFNLDSLNYFQTGIMYFDTKIIEESTKKNLLELAEDFPISITNEQGIMNLYFANIKNQYVELIKKIDDYTSYFYWLVDTEKIIITKQLRSKYK